VGVAFLEADDTAQSLVKRADNFMYTAKTTGERVAIVCFGQILQHAERPARLTKAKRL